MLPTSAPKSTTHSLFSPRRRTSSFRRTKAYLTSPAMTRCSTSAGIIRSTTISTRSPATHRNGTSRHGRVAEGRGKPIVTTGCSRLPPFWGAGELFSFAVRLFVVSVGTIGRADLHRSGQLPGLAAGAVTNGVQLSEFPLRARLRRARHRNALAVQGRHQLRPRQSLSQVRLRFQPRSLRRRHRDQLSGHMDVRDGPALQSEGPVDHRESEESDSVHRRFAAAIYFSAHFPICLVRAG